MRIGLLGVGLLLVGVSCASAQTSEADVIPDVGWVGLGGQGGWRIPTDDRYQSTWIVAGRVDVYLSRRVALRPGMIWAEPEMDTRRADVQGRRESLRQVGFLLDLVGNWRSGKWQPYVSAGVGLHLFQQKLPGRVVLQDDEVHFGGAFGGGIEYFVRQTTAITGEFSYQAIERGRLQTSPSASLVFAGIKQYF